MKKEEEFNLHEVIGQIICSHALIEYMLANWLASLINEDFVIGKIVTCEMSCKNLTQAFQSIMSYKATTKELYKKHLPEIKKLVANINKEEQERNSIAHSLNMNAFNVNMKYKETSKLKNGFTPKFDVLENSHFDKIQLLQYSISEEMQRLQLMLKEN